MHVIRAAVRCGIVVSLTLVLTVFVDAGSGAAHPGGMQEVMICGKSIKVGQVAENVKEMLVPIRYEPCYYYGQTCAGYYQDNGKVYKITYGPADSDTTAYVVDKIDMIEEKEQPRVISAQHHPGLFRKGKIKMFATK